MWGIVFAEGTITNDTKGSGNYCRCSEMENAIVEFDNIIWISFILSQVIKPAISQKTLCKKQVSPFVCRGCQMLVTGRRGRLPIVACCTSVLPQHLAFLALAFCDFQLLLTTALFSLSPFSLNCLGSDIRLRLQIIESRHWKNLSRIKRNQLRCFRYRRKAEKDKGRKLASHAPQHSRQPGEIDRLFVRIFF
jgi:hypothetical protein